MRIAARLLPTGPQQRAGYFAVKHIVELALAVLLLPLALLLIGISALLVLVSSGRPVFYRQLRVGKQGQVFAILKLRTMRHNAELATGPVWSGPDDPRVTWLGKWLRRTHLDELPQILNVISGQMNLIGPRPERPEIVCRLAREIPGYLNRYAVLPGITGLAQVQHRSDQVLADVRCKLRHDLDYIRTASLFGDLQILLRTIPHVLGVCTGSAPRSGDTDNDVPVVDVRPTDQRPGKSVKPSPQRASA